MTEQQRSLYTETAKRLARLGANDPTAQIIALAEEIKGYREKIHDLEESPKKAGLRLCKVEGLGVCSFHGFFADSTEKLKINVLTREKEERKLLGDFAKGIVRPGASIETLYRITALVECIDGSVKKVDPESVRFFTREDVIP